MNRLRLPALLLLACLALAGPQSAAAQTPSPSARELHDDYPLDPSRESARASAQVTPTATAEPDSSPSSRVSLQHAMVAMLMVFGFATGFALAVRSGRLRPKSEPEYAAEPAAPANGPAPPAKRRAWTAEIEWGPAEAGACFCVVARPVDGGATAIVAESAQLEWPPSSAAAVAAMTAAADDLEARLVAAGWQPLPRGDAWYARRFHWEPAVQDAVRPDALWRQSRDSAQPMVR